MDYYARERIIKACLNKLPYPVEFYGRLSDGSLWNVYQKHVVNGIPINKRELKAKAKAEADAKRGPQQLSMDDIKTNIMELNIEEAACMYSNLSVEEATMLSDEELSYLAYAAQEWQDSIVSVEIIGVPEPPLLQQDGEGNWWRLNDAGTYDLVPDSDLDDTLDTFNGGVVVEETGKQLSLQRVQRRNNGTSQICIRKEI